MIQFDLPKERDSIIKVIGVGGGGSNAVINMYNQGIKGVNFIVCNTDAQAMDLTSIPNKVQLGPSLTEGRGAGSLPEIGREAAIESLDEIREFLMSNTKMVFITAGMGGGTGTGGAPVIAELAQELGILTVGIVTTPFSFEGRRRHQQAEEGLAEFKKHVDSILIVSNDKLREMHGDLRLSDAFTKADNILTIAAKGIAEIITVTGYVNVDFEDVNTVMRNSGVAIMGAAVAEGEDRANRVVQGALSSPLLNDNDIKGANYILLNITSGTKEVTMDEISEITDYIQAEAGNNADIIWGNCYDEALGEQISLTIIATGFESNQHAKVANSRGTEKIILPLEDTPSSAKNHAQTDAPSENPTPQNQITFEFDMNSPKPDSYKKVPEKITDNEPQTRAYKEETVSKEKYQPNKNASVGMRLKNSYSITELEREPAYLRRNVNLDKVVHSSEDTNLSRYTLSESDKDQTDNERPIIRKNNSFLHDNVD